MLMLNLMKDNEILVLNYHQHGRRDVIGLRHTRLKMLSPLFKLTGLNNVLLPTLFTLVNNIELYC
jgi:hypothetical protein